MIRVIVHVAKAIVAAITALLFSSCGFADNFKTVDGNNNVTTQTRTVAGEYNAIAVSRGLEVIIEASNEKSIIIEADENLHSHIQTIVENGVLEITSDVNIGKAASKKVIVKLPEIGAIEASSAATVKSTVPIKGKSLELSTNSGAFIEVPVEVDNLTCESSSGSTLKVSGQAQNLEAEASSGGTVDAAAVAAGSVKSDASSGGTSIVNPIDELSADASSGGKIYYVNTPSQLTKETSSGGEVHQQ